MSRRKFSYNNFFLVASLLAVAITIIIQKTQESKEKEYPKITNSNNLQQDVYNYLNASQPPAEKKDTVVEKQEPEDYTAILKVYQKDMLASPSLQDADDARKLYETMAIKWDYLNRAKNYGEANQQAYIKSFENKLLNYQAKYFPRIRKAYVDNLDRKLWVEDSGAKLIGSNEVRFTGRLFLRNKNKQDTYNEIKDVLEDFRFKRCSFQWHEYDDIITYAVTSLKDRDEIQ